MIRKAIFSGIFVFAVTWSAFSQKVTYKLTMPEPNTHYFHVEMTFSENKDKELLFKLPVWAPGSYMVREFSKHINQVRATDDKGKIIQINKIDKNTWKVDASKTKSVTLIYEVYAFDLTVRTSFLDHTHGYLNGTSVFMYVDKYKDLAGRVEVVPHISFADVACALTPVAEGFSSDVPTFVFQFDNYDQLVDCPMEIGNHERFEFIAAGIKHSVVIYGEGNHDVEQLKTDMAKIVNSTAAVFGSNPNKNYLFIIHNTEKGGGGLEHSNSTTLNVRRFSYEGRRYLGFLSLVAHEYFHLWNVKRLRPVELGPFDYDQENYTSLLWVMEGFTSYYDELLLRRAGFYTQEQYLKTLFNTINSVENQPGNKIQPLAHASFDAWIKAYHPNENSYNTTISYYSKGQLIGAVIDAMIISSSKGKKSLDEFMQLLYDKYFLKANRGFTEAEFKQDLEAFMGQKLDSFFEDYIHGTKPLDYASAFASIGLDLVKKESTEAFFGTSLSESEGKLLVKRVQRESAAEKAGISANDEIIAINGFRTNQAGFNEFIASIQVGDVFDVMISRDGKIMNLKSAMGEIEKVNYSYKFNGEASKQKMLEFWLREK